MHLILDGLMVLTVFGCVQAVAGLVAVWAFAARRPKLAASYPPVTILKPVCGDEPELEAAIASFCAQAYPDFQLVIGAQDPNDPALDVARRVQARFPQCDIAIVADPTRHGSNRKIANLINMLPAARHDVLVMADSDLHVRPDYLSRIVDALQLPGTGLVTTLGAGAPATACIAADVGAMHMNHIFLPGALLAVGLGRQDCLGGTMALTRETLCRVGGLAALVAHLADDNVLGALVRRLGMSIRIADTLPIVTVPETSLRALWLHELRWARTIGALAPVAFTASVLQYPLFWGLLAVMVSGGAPRPLLCFAAAWALRAAVAHGINHALTHLRARPAPPVRFWLLPLRDVLSVAELVASFRNDEVVWRGHRMQADRGVAATDAVVEEKTQTA
jgi:ceramide glucosyltransferase